MWGIGASKLRSKSSVQLLGRGASESTREISIENQCGGDHGGVRMEAKPTKSGAIII
jgi:hypothetical protein